MQTSKQTTTPMQSKTAKITPKPYERYGINSIRFSDGERIELDPEKSVATFHDIELLDKIFSADRDLKMCADFEAAILPAPWEDPLIGSPWGDATTLLEAAMATDELLRLAEQSRDARLATKPPRIQITGKTLALVLNLCAVTEALPSDEVITIGKNAPKTRGVDASYGDTRFIDGETPTEALLMLLIYAMTTLLNHPKTKEFNRLTANTDKGNRVSWSVCRLRIQAAWQALQKGLNHTEQQDCEGKFDVGVCH